MKEKKRESINIFDPAIEKLCAGIVKQACEDYLNAKYAISDMNDTATALKKLKNRKDMKTQEDFEKIREYEIAKEEVRIREVERFFKSDWYGMLCGADGMKILQILDKKHERGEKLSLTKPV